MWARTCAHPSHHFDVMRTGSFVLYRPFAAAISLSIKWKTIRSSTFQFISFVQFNKCLFLRMKMRKQTLTGKEEQPGLYDRGNDRGG